MSLDPIRDAERDKYSQIWTKVPDYRRHSPGERLLGTFRTYVDPQGLKIIDFGCGTGRAALALQKAGADVIGVDITFECLDPHVRDELLFFLEACLWDLPPGLSCDFGYCTDVMEHIPPSHVDAVLAGIRKACKVGTFFQIACFPDNFGRRIGKTLHETVKPAEWWAEKLRDLYSSVELAEIERRRIVAVCRV